ncbi:MAG: substrate-binding domain-containing protein [Candidatus Hydrogenedentes bacterium]|nr:substrate-binding domain-containing protein [Candidatus Hydrogenedentota bacterium]
MARFRSTLFSLAALCTLAVGCNQQPTSDSGKPKIGAIVLQEDQFFRLNEFGMRAAAAELGVEVSVNNSFGTLDKEISLIDTYMANQVAALVVPPQSATSSIPALKRAFERGIPVVTYDSYIDADFAASNIRSDQISLGSTTGDAAVAFIQERLGGQAKVGMVEYVSLAPEPGGQRVQGFRDKIKALPGVEIVSEQDAWLAEAATVVVENMLTAHPEINVLWAANEGGTVGAVNGVISKGLAGKVYVFGTDMSEQIGGFLLAQDDVLQAVTGQKPYDIGHQALTAAVKAMKGEAVEKKVVLPGMLFARNKPEDVQAYVKVLQDLTK